MCNPRVLVSSALFGRYIFFSLSEACDLGVTNLNKFEEVKVNLDLVKIRTNTILGNWKTDKHVSKVDKYVCIKFDLLFLDFIKERKTYFYLLKKIIF